MSALSQLAGTSNTYIGDPSQVGSYTGAYSNPTLRAQIDKQTQLYNNALYNPIANNSAFADALGSSVGPIETDPLSGFASGGQSLADLASYGQKMNDPSNYLTAQFLNKYLPQVQSYYHYGDVAGAPQVQGGINTVNRGIIHGAPIAGAPPKNIR